MKTSDTPKNVLTYGTFDLFHVGHLRILQKAKKLACGGQLFVGVSTDDFNKNDKNKRTVVPYDERVEILSAVGCVDHVFPETCWDQKESDILKYKIDLFVIGDDWKGRFDKLAKLCEVEYLPRTSNISTTFLIDSILARGIAKFE